MKRYLLDTNILSDAIKNPQGKVAEKIAAHQQSICTSIIVAAELRYGAAKKASPTLTERVEKLLQSIIVIPLGEDADRHYGQLRTQLEREGRIVGANDLFIAAHAIALGYVLVTDNLREFSRIFGLTTENWLHKA